MHGRSYVASFNFKGPDQQKLVGNLSGGERNRVHLAKVLKEGANVLLLDEPTNDLDVDTLRALEDAIEAYAGCAVIISHDRWFLDRVATHIIAFEGDSPGSLVRRQLHRLRRVPPTGARRRRHAAPADQVQARHPQLTDGAGRDHRRRHERAGGDPRRVVARQGCCPRTPR